MKPVLKAKTSEKKKSTSIPKTAGKSSVAVQEVAVTPAVVTQEVMPTSEAVPAPAAATQPASAKQNALSITVSVITQQPLHEEFSSMVARRAYELWEQGNCRHGHDVDNWLTAEKELSI